MNIAILKSPRRPDHLRERPLHGVTDKKYAGAQVQAFHWVMIAGFAFLTWGYFDLQVNNEAYYRELAKDNKIKNLPVSSVRGRIVDREGRLIVDSLMSFKAVLTPEYFKPDQLPLIIQGLGLDQGELEAKLKRLAKLPRYQPIVIKQNLSAADVAFIEAHKQQEMLPSLDIVASQDRVYPKGTFMSHVLGYVGEVSEKELDLPEFATVKPGDLVGKNGLERFYNEHLTGKDGYRRVMINNRGRELAVLDSQAAKPGNPLQLTIDLELQAVAELALEGKRGALVALDPRNGEVLAMVSRPAYDLNKFARGISAADWKEITENVEKPMFHRAIQASLAPGSTFKPVVALAGLEEGVITPGFTARCTGSYQVAERAFHCHARSGHGVVGLQYGMAQSCDVFFYTVGSMLGITKLHKWGDLAGFGRKTGIDLPNEDAGVLPSVDWKLKKMREGWRQGDTVNAAIGQGFVAVTPLQLAHGIGGIATGGVWVQPHLVKGSGSIAGRESRGPTKANVNLDNINKIIEAMYGVVHRGGTGREAWLPNTEVCGKTGTAQIISNETIERRGLKGVIKDNAWFVAFAPRYNAEIVVAGLWEAGDHGASASIMVRDVIKAYFDKKGRADWQRRQLAASTAAKSEEAVVAVDTEHQADHTHAGDTPATPPNPQRPQ